VAAYCEKNVSAKNKTNTQQRNSSVAFFVATVCGSFRTGLFFSFYGSACCFICCWVPHNAWCVRSVCILLLFHSLSPQERKAETTTLDLASNSVRLMLSVAARRLKGGAFTQSAWLETEK